MQLMNWPAGLGRPFLAAANGNRNGDRARCLCLPLRRLRSDGVIDP